MALWADGPCAPVQERLRELVDGKVNDVRQQLAELNGFAAQLDHLRASLAAIAPAGRCGPGCGCDTDVAAPIGCTLSSDDRAGRASAWAELLAHATDHEPTARGVRMRFDAEPRLVSAVADLAVREAECCSFFSFTLTVDAERAWFEVAAPPDGRVVVDALFA